MFEVGDLVEYYKKPTQKDWERVGEVPIFFKKGDILEVTAAHNTANGSIEVKGRAWCYPKECFRLVSEREPEFIFHI